jgi:hypothetical protein
MKKAKKADKKKFSGGDAVQVRSFAEIAATLDDSGMLEGMPFLPEMLEYCGRTMTVRWRVNKVLQGYDKGGLRAIKSTVLLDEAFCNGEAHGDCQRMCFFLWKTAWLKPERGRSPDLVESADGGALAEADPRVRDLPRDRVCQATALTAATAPLRLLDPRRYYWDMTSRLYEPAAYFRYLLGGIYRKTLKRVARRLRRDRGLKFDAAGSDKLSLGRGDLVEVKSVKEIRATLDRQGRNRGLYFMPNMWAFCGNRFRVLRPVYRMLSEKTGGMRPRKNIVILNGVTCSGRSQGGCQRGCHIFWKEAWLRRVPEDLHWAPIRSPKAQGGSAGAEKDSPNRTAS